MQPNLQVWLDRKAIREAEKAARPRYRIPRRKPERAKQERRYNARVKVWLTLPQNKWCAIWLAKRGLTWQDVDENGMAGWEDDGVRVAARCPRATECHHMDSRFGSRLLDESKWCPASHWEHAWVKQNQSEARRIGVLV
ncbi:MAG: hypothetical protein JSR30_00240 [Proteobacteria bacterium]|nr:hypothetical protein [Pseudomonadota bacterium]